MNYLKNTDMELKMIRQILQKYFEGKSSEQEEQLLENYFRSGNVAKDLEEYRDFFGGFHEISAKRDKKLEDEIMDFILENEHREKNRYRWLWQTVSGIAAAIVIAVIAVNFYTAPYKWEDTYTDPDQAYAEASNVMRYVAGRYQKGLENLQPVKKLNVASKPLQRGMDKLQKGFQEVENLEKLNDKIKNQEP